MILHFEIEVWLRDDKKKQVMKSKANDRPFVLWKN